MTTLKTKDELLVDFTPNQQQAITAEKHQDLIESSMGVSATGGTDPQTLGTGGDPRQIRSFRKRGGRQDVVNEQSDTLVIPAGGDGIYFVSIQADLNSDKNTTLYMEVYKNGEPTGIIARDDYSQNQTKPLQAAGGVECITGDEISLYSMADNPATTITVESSNILIARL